MSNETDAPTPASPKASGGCCGSARNKPAAAQEEARYHALRTLIAALRATDHVPATPAPAQKGCCCG